MSASDVLSNLREWQKAALHEWLSGTTTGIAEVATGGGKNRLALACMASWQADPTDHCLVLVPTLALQDQWVVSIEDELGAPRNQICAWGEDRDPDVQFHVMVINTARTQAHEVANAAGRLFLVA